MTTTPPAPSLDDRPGCEDLATRWLDAEARARTEPANTSLADEAARLGDAYELAITEATAEELRLAWEAARRLQEAEEIGSVPWSDARRVSELLRTEYQAARDRSPSG